MKYLLLIFTLYISPVLALTVDAPLEGGVQEARAKALFSEIRCVVCQSESIADSPAEIARDLRRAIREDVAAGKDNEAIKAALVAAYGERILMQPPLENHLALWFAPLLLLLAGGALAWRKLFR